MSQIRYEKLRRVGRERAFRRRDHGQEKLKTKKNTPTQCWLTMTKFFLEKPHTDHRRGILLENRG